MIGQWRPVCSNPLRARQLVFQWGSESIEYGLKFDGYHVEQCMGALHGWHLTLLRDAGVISGIEATRNTVENGRWANRTICEITLALIEKSSSNRSVSESAQHSVSSLVDDAFIGSPNWMTLRTAGPQRSSSSAAFSVLRSIKTSKLKFSFNTSIASLAPEL